MTKRKRTGKSPLRLGPVLIHYRKDQNTYSSFLQSLIDLKSALQGMLLTGTDGEQALVNAIEAKLPNAHSRNLRCFRHFQDNFKEALASYGMVGMISFLKLIKNLLISFVYVMPGFKRSVN